MNKVVITNLLSYHIIGYDNDKDYFISYHVYHTL